MKLYNIFFPIWILIFFPPIIFAALGINFMVDSAVLLLCFSIFRHELLDGLSVIETYKKTIIKVWLYGFLADFIGAVYLFTVVTIVNAIGMDSAVLAGITYNPLNNAISFGLVVSAVMLSGGIIYLLDSKLVLRKYLRERNRTYSLNISDKTYRYNQEFWSSKIIALIIAVITAPWTFLIPYEVFEALF